MAFRKRSPRRIPPAGTDDKRLLSEAINGAADGRTGEVTLTENAASTVVTDERVGETPSCVTLTPLTANAAAEIGNGTLYIAHAAGAFTITHANNAQTDRTFRYAVNN